MFYKWLKNIGREIELIASPAAKTSPISSRNGDLDTPFFMFTNLLKVDLEKLNGITSLKDFLIKLNFADRFEVKNATVVAAEIEADHVLDSIILMRYLQQN